MAEGGAIKIEDDRGKTERLFYLASIFVNESACWTGKGETYTGMRDLKSKKNY